MLRRYFLADLRATASGRSSERLLRPEPSPHFCQLSFLVASSEDATTSLGSRTSRIIRLSGNASTRLLDHKVVLRAEEGEGVPGAGQDEVPYRGDPTVPGRGAHDEVRGLPLFCGGVDVELPEEVADPRLFPDFVPAHLTHHPGQPGAPATGDAEDPQDVGGVHAPVLKVHAPAESRTTRADDASGPHRRGAQPAPHGGKPRVPGGGPPPDPPCSLPRPQSGKHRRFLSFICLTLRRRTQNIRILPPPDQQVNVHNPAVPGTLQWQAAVSSASFGAIDTLQNGEAPCVPEDR